MCGDGVRTGAEECDGTDIGGDGTCAGLYGPSYTGVPTCSPADASDPAAGCRILPMGCTLVAGEKDGPALVTIPTTTSGTMRIDATEVTNGQYEIFLAAEAGTTVMQPSFCQWNADFHADATCLAGAGESAWCTGAECLRLPRVCIDWCDAAAYCAWAGKRLCGDPSGGPAPAFTLGDASKNQWTNACTSGGAHAYPYGDTFVAASCNGVGGVGHPVAAGSTPSCAAAPPYADVLDLNGNVWEWQDDCTSTGDNDACPTRGGAYNSQPSDLSCTSGPGFNRQNQHPAVGFRCCE